MITLTWQLIYNKYVKDFYMRYPWFEMFSMQSIYESHSQLELGYKRKKRIVIARQLRRKTEAAKNSVFSVLREARSKGRTFVT